MKKHLRALCLASVVGAFAFYGSGCSSTSPVHISKAHLVACQKVSSETADTHWAVLKWFADEYSHPDKSELALGAAVKGLSNAEALVRSNWRDRQLERFDFLVPDEVSLIASDLTAAAPGKLQEAIHEFENGILVAPKLDEVGRFFWIVGLAASPGFSEFVKKEHRLPLEPTVDPRLIAGLRQEIVKKSSATMSTIKNLIKAEKYRDAYAQLQQEIPSYAQTTVEQSLIEERSRVAPLYLLAEISRIRATGFETAKANQETLETLYAARQSWSGDAPLRAAFAEKAVQAAFVELQTDIGEAQGLLWQGEMKALAGKTHYWRLFLYHKQCLDMAAKLEKPVQAEAREAAWEEFLALAAGGYAHFLKQAESEIQRGERHGTAIIIYEMMGEIEQFIATHQRELSQAAVQHLKDARRRAVESQKFHGLYVRRRLFIDEIMPKDGLGAELRRELESEFSRLSRESSLLFGVEVGEGGQAQATPRDYMFTRGIYTPPDAVYGKDFVVQKNVTLKGEVLEKDNPAYLKASSRERESKGIPPKLYEQVYYKFTISHKTIEAVATARLGYTLEYRGERDIHSIDLQHSLRRVFIQESIDPNQTERYTEPISGPPEDPGQKDPRPELTQERVLTILEMREWARGEIRRVTIMRLLAALAAYPLNLVAEAETAEKEDSWQMAANSLGIAFAYCRHLDAEKATKSEYVTSDTQASYLKDEYARNTRLVKDIVRLQQELWDRCKDAYVKYQEAD